MPDSQPGFLPVAPRRDGSPRERRGRGTRGPIALPGPLSPRATALRPSRRDDFDDLVVSLVDRLSRRWAAELVDVEFATEDAPVIPDDWGLDPVPLATVVRSDGTQPARVVLFRRPIELRAKARVERAALVHDVLVENVAELLGRDPSEIDPP